MIKKIVVYYLLACGLFHHIMEAAPAQVLILSSAEKSGDSLSMNGRARAAAYVAYFTESKDFINLGPIAAIYAMKPFKGALSTGPIETVKPLAASLNITINENFIRNDYKNMVQTIMADPSLEGKTILIAWESVVIPEMARAFKALLTPYKWQADVVDRVWLLSLSATGRATFQNIPQRLMFGDTAH